MVEKIIEKIPAFIRNYIDRMEYDETLVVTKADDQLLFILLDKPGETARARWWHCPIADLNDDSIDRIIQDMNAA